MSGRTTKRLKKYARAMWEQHLLTIGEAPFWYRVRVAWYTIIGRAPKR